MKGISAVVSTVMVLLVSVAAVGLFSSWAPDIVQDLTSSTGNQSRNQVDCNDADLEIESAEYWDSKSNTTAVVRNTGTMKLNNVRIEAWEDDIPMNFTVTTLKPGNFTTENITTTREPTSVRTVSQECSNAQDRFEDIK